MKRLRFAVVAAVVALAGLGVAAPAQASKCGQYPTFMEPLLCRRIP